MHISNSKCKEDKGNLIANNLIYVFFVCDNQKAVD